MPPTAQLFDRALVLTGLLCLSACGTSSPASRTDVASGQRPSQTQAGPSASHTATAGPIVLGERLTRRVIDDGKQGMPVGVVAVPESWRFESNITWNFAHLYNPAIGSVRAENPKNDEAYFGYPAAEYFTLRPAATIYHPGQDVSGLLFAEPVQPVQALARVVQQMRGRETKIQFVGSKELPELAASLKVPASPNQHGVGVKVTYDLNGRPVEEEFYGIYYLVEIPYDGPQGRTWQINWGLANLHSFRAPAGTLDARRPIFAAIARSGRPNPAWLERAQAIKNYLAAEFNRQQQAGYDQIAAAGELSRRISANNDAMIASIDHQLQASRAQSPSADAAARSANDKFSDLIRGVDTVEDPYYGSSQHASTEQFHWTDGYGNYRNSNDVTYDPNRTEVGQWQPMRPIR